MFDSVKQLYLHRERENLFKKQAWKELAEACQKLVEIDAQDFKALHDLVVALREIKDYDRAGRWCEAVLKLAPKAAPEHQLALEGPRYLRYIVVCAEVFFRQGRLDQARRLLLPLKKVGSHFHKKHFLLSEIYEKQGNLAQAAAELEEMQELYSGLGIHQWEHMILVRCRELLPSASAKRDADAVLIAYRTIVKISLRKSEIEQYIRARESDPKLRQETLCLKALAALLQRKLPEAEAAAKQVDWPELADRLLALAWFEQGRAAESANALKRLPPGSALRLDLLRKLKPTLFSDPEFLREYARSHLEGGWIEEAYEAYQALTTHAACGIEDLERCRALRELLLDRNIWEDEARLALPAGSPGGNGGPAGEETESIPLQSGGRQISVRVSEAFRMWARRSSRGDSSEIKFRLAENYLRRGVKPEQAVSILQELSKGESSMKARALCSIALHFIRKGDAGSASGALRSFSEAAASLSSDDRKRMLLDLGDSCEAAGLAEMAKICYGSILAEDISYADVTDRKRRLDSAAQQPRPAPAEAASARIRERYADLRAIGRGGMGVVYRAFDPLYARVVALKVLSDRYRGDEAAVARFLREGQAMAQLLRHPGIVRVYEVGVGADMYIAMEFVAGASLRARLKESGRIPLKEIASIGAQVCEALGFAHKSGIVHRDVKPDNVLLTEEGKVKLVDFGLADISTATVLTQVGAVMGTGAYMSPEQVQGAEADARSDIYSLGAMLFELAAGQPPFKGDVSYMHVNVPAPLLRSKDPAIPAAFEALVARCLEKDPAKRFSTCEELARALKEVP